MGSQIAAVYPCLEFWVMGWAFGRMRRRLHDWACSWFPVALVFGGVRQAQAQQVLEVLLTLALSPQIDMLQAEVTALKTLVITSTPSSPNRELHPQLQSPSKAVFRKGHGRNKSTSSAMVSAASQNVTPEPVSRECKEVGEGHSLHRPWSHRCHCAQGAKPLLTRASWRALWFQCWERLSMQSSGLFPKFVLRQALEGFRLWRFPLLGSMFEAASGQLLEEAAEGSLEGMDRCRSCQC